MYDGNGLGTAPLANTKGAGRLMHPPGLPFHLYNYDMVSRRRRAGRVLRPGEASKAPSLKPFKNSLEHRRSTTPTSCCGCVSILCIQHRGLSFLLQPRSASITIAIRSTTFDAILYPNLGARKIPNLSSFPSCSPSPSSSQELTKLPQHRSTPTCVPHQSLCHRR